MRLRAAEDCLHAGDELLGIEGLGQVVVRAHVKAIEHVLVSGLGREHYHGYVGELAQAPADFVPIHSLRQQDVEQHEVGLFEGCHLEGGFAGASGYHLVAHRSQYLADQPHHPRCVVYDEDLITHPQTAPRSPSVWLALPAEA